MLPDAILPLLAVQVNIPQYFHKPRKMAIFNVFSNRVRFSDNNSRAVGRTESEYSLKHFTCIYASKHMRLETFDKYMKTTDFSVHSV